MSDFGWSYPPGCNSVPGDEEEPECIICGVAVPPKNLYCGASCERADEEQLVDDDWLDYADSWAIHLERKE